jgi:hypothetical protein
MLSDELSLLCSLTLVLIATVAALGASILYLRGHRPARGRTRQQERDWQSSPLDVSLLRPAMHRVRDDYLQALRSRPHPRFHSRPLIEAARQSILRMDYFHQEKEDD